MGKISQLTPEQEAQIPVYIDRYIRLASEPTNRKKATQAVQDIYKSMREKRPLVIFGQSPLTTAIMAAMYFILVKTKPKKLHGQLGGQLYDQLGGQLRDQLRGQLGGQLYDQLRDQLGGQLKTINSHWYLSVWWLAWAGWYAYAQYIGVKFDDKIYSLFMNFACNISFCIPCKGIVFISENPKRISWENGRLHNDGGKSVEYADGYGIYTLKGVSFNKDEELWQKIVDRKMTAKEIMQIRDVDKREVAKSMLPPNEMQKQLKGKLIDTGSEGTKLYECKNFEGTGRTEYYMTMKDWSTPREFIEFVPPSIGKKRDAVFAQASAYNIPLEDYLAIKDRG